MCIWQSHNIFVFKTISEKKPDPSLNEPFLNILNRVYVGYIEQCVLKKRTPESSLQNFTGTENKISNTWVIDVIIQR